MISFTTYFLESVFDIRPMEGAGGDIFAKIAFIGKHFFHGLMGMTAAGDAERKGLSF